jgi:hippurate hydrolase
MLNLALLFLVVFQNPVREASQSWLSAEEGELLEIYKDLHANPELSFQESRTAGIMSTILKDLGFRVQKNIGGHGVAGILENGEGPVVLVRTDTDGLPITEKTGLAFASKVRAREQDGREVGVMHACGHDMHMTVWAGTAAFLASHKDLWSGTLLFVAQPAEERGAGARAMLEDGLFSRTATPDYCLAFHVAPFLPAGAVGFCPEFALANVDSVDIRVRGKGGHGSTPEVTHDPVVLAARIVVALQTLVSRETAAQKSAVVTVGSIHGGAKHNIIPNEVFLQLTVRSYESEVRKNLLDGIRRTAKYEALAAGFPKELLPEVQVLKEHTPAAWNSPELVSRNWDAIEKVLGAQGVQKVPSVMGGEDFGRYAPAAGCPGNIMWLGVVSKEAWALSQKPNAAPLPGLHTATFAPDALASIRTGVKAMSAAVVDILAR